MHVRHFFEHLLGCSVEPARLQPDGIAPNAAGGVLGDIYATYGAVEPQMRGSLHIHMLIHVLGFVSPHLLVQQFHSRWAELQQRLRAWIESICFTSVEALPRYLGLPDVKSALSELRPLPYTDLQKELLGDRWSEHIANASWRWLPGSESAGASAA